MPRSDKKVLVLYGAFARFSSWIPTNDGFQAFLDYIDHDWGKVTRSILP